MTEKTEHKVEALPDLDDLLQCPVCYEIPSGQIFQCNEGHHVCGKCKMRLDVCPVCRAFFFGTRNYAMEELIANVRKLQAFKLGGKVTTVGSPTVEETPPVQSATSSGDDNDSNYEVDDTDNAPTRLVLRAPPACKGLFRCLCCKNDPERLPLARLLNHLRYYHSPDLIEGQSEDGVYLQAWQFPTVPGRMVTAVRVHDMGVFFLIVEVTEESVQVWLTMAATPWVCHEFLYSFTLSGNDREIVFTDCVWSVRTCEGSLKKRGRCLSLSGADGRSILMATVMNGKLSIRRNGPDMHTPSMPPRVVLRVANRSNAPAEIAHDLEPFLQDLQNDVARLSRAFASLGREADALIRTETQMRGRLEDAASEPTPPTPPAVAPVPPEPQNPERQMSKSARRRMRQRLREALRVSQGSEGGSEDDTRAVPSASASRPAPHRAGARGNGAQTSDVAQVSSQPQNNQAGSSIQNARSQTNNSQRVCNGSTNVPQVNVSSNSTRDIVDLLVRLTNGQVASPVPNGSDVATASPVAPSTLPPTASGGSTQVGAANGNTRNKKKRRQRR